MDSLVSRLNVEKNHDQNLVIDKAVAELEKSKDQDDQDTAGAVKTSGPGARVTNAIVNHIAGEFQKQKIRGVVNALTLLDPELSKGGIESAKGAIEVRYLMADGTHTNKEINYKEGAGGFGSEKNAADFPPCFQT